MRVISRSLCFAACFLALCVMLSLGCRFGGKFPPGDDVGSPPAIQSGMIQGVVTASGPLSISPSRFTILTQQTEAASQTLIASADVWLQEDFSNQTQTSASGVFTLQDIPLEKKYRVVAKFISGGKVHKVRSTEITLSSQNPVQGVGSMSLREATNTVKGILRDSNGNPIRNATITVWGEPVTPDEFGRYETPAIPGVDPIEEIIITGIEGIGSATIVAAFSSDGSTILETEMPPAGVTNALPQGVLKKESFNKSFVQPGNDEGFWVFYWDPDTGEAANAVVTWSVTQGTFVPETGNPPNSLVNKFKDDFPSLDYSQVHTKGIKWTAPATNTYSLITAKVQDPKGSSAELNLLITVGAGQSQPPGNLPPAANIIASNVVYAGEDLALTVEAVDPDLPFGFYWSDSPAIGHFNNRGDSSTLWTAPNSSGTFEISCKVLDYKGAFVIVQHSVQVLPIVSTGKGTIIGKVIDHQTRSGIEGALIVLKGTGFRTVSIADGSFTLSDIPPGTYDLIIMRDDFIYKTYPGIVVTGL